MKKRFNHNPITSKSCLIIVLALIFIPLTATLPAQPTTRAIDDPLKIHKSSVYDIFGPYSVRGTKLHPASIRDMLGGRAATQRAIRNSLKNLKTLLEGGRRAGAPSRS